MGVFTRLEQAGILVRKRLSAVHPGEVTGYAVALPEYTGQDGELRWSGEGGWRPG